MGLNKADSDTTVENQQQQQQLPQNNISPLPINIITQNKNSKINKKILKEKNSHTNVIINNNNNSSSITNNNNNNNNSKKIFDLNHKPNDSNLGVGGKTTMAPALTEPLRSANQLTSSSSPNAASASPRPHTATTNTNSSKKNGNTRLLNEFPMGPMSEPNTNITDTTSSMGTNNFENIIENIPITLVHLENDFEEAISAEICMKGGVVLNNSKEKFINNVNNFNTNNTDTNTNNANAVIAAAADKQQESIDHMDLGPESDQITDNVHSNEPQHQQQQIEEPQNEQQQQRRQEPDLLLPSSPPASLASQHNIGSEEKLAGFDFKELPRISQDSTITASEGNDLDDNLSINSNPSPTKSCSQSNNQKESNSQTEDMDLEDIDLLNVFKNLESGNENLTDLAGSLNLFNDVMSYEDDISSSVISSSCVNTNSRISPTIVLESKELQADIKKMQRQIDFLNRRLRKLQTRNVCQQASEEISGLFEWSNRITRRKDYDPTRQAVHEEEIQRPVSAASMRSVLKKIDTISNQQRLISSKKKVGRPSSTPGPSVSVDKNQPLSTLIPQYDVKTIEEILQTAGSLQSELRLAEQGMDSDATLSSSGGESADENITYNNQTQQVAPIAKRAAWVYSCDRASIAAKWTWLLSQISDLEYKKRQHEELYQKLKSSKGAVALKMSCDEVSAKDVNIENEEEDSACRTRPFDRTAFRKRKLLQTANVHTISKKAARPSSVKCGCQWPLYPCALCTGRTDPTTPRDLPDTMLMQERASLLDNGFHPVLSFSNEKSYSIHFEATCNSYDWRSRCLRCTAKSAIKSVIAAQKAAIKSERSSMQSILPGFKKNEKGELVPKRKYKKKIQVPSDFYSDDGGGSGSSTPYPANKGSKSSKKHHSRNNHSGEQGHSSSMYHQNLNSTIPTSSSAQRNKIRKISSSTSFLNSSSISNNGNSFGGNDSFDNLMDSNLNGCRSRNSSPTHSYYRPSDKRSRNSYDIDNIVIPYSVAASTRVELLPYKEIPTPKWRMMDDDDFLLNPDEANEIINDFDKNSIDKLFDEFVTTCPNDKAENNIDGLLNISMSSSSCDITKPGIPNDSELDKSPDIQNNDTSSSSATPTTTINHPKTTTTTDTLNSPQVSESFSKSPLKMGCNINNNDGSTDDQQIEDTSDDAYALRHERGLQDERKKFATYLKFPFSTRSRANRRADSRTNSSGANTPDPSSPATTVPNIGVDQEPIPSPTMPPTPQTPFEGFENEPGTTTGGKKRNERKRTTSSKRDRERSSTPDLREIVPPFDPLQFPLPNEVYEEMLKMMPADHHTLDEYLPNNSTPVKEEEILPSMVPPLNGLTTGIMSNVNNSSGNIGGVCNNNNSSNNSSIINISQNIKNSSTDLMGNIMFNNYANSTLIDSSTILNSSETLLDDSETESVETNTGEDDPNDPEWKGEAQ